MPEGEEAREGEERVVGEVRAEDNQGLVAAADIKRMKIECCIFVFTLMFFSFYLFLKAAFPNRAQHLAGN